MYNTQPLEADRDKYDFFNKALTTNEYIGNPEQPRQVALVVSALKVGDVAAANTNQLNVGLNNLAGLISCWDWPSYLADWTNGTVHGAGSDPFNGGVFPTINDLAFYHFVGDNGPSSHGGTGCQNNGKYRSFTADLATDFDANAINILAADACIDCFAMKAPTATEGRGSPLPVTTLDAKSNVWIPPVARSNWSRQDLAPYASNFEILVPGVGRVNATLVDHADFAGIFAWDQSHCGSPAGFNMPDISGYGPDDWIFTYHFLYAVEDMGTPTYGAMAWEEPSYDREDGWMTVFTSSKTDLTNMFDFTHPSIGYGDYQLTTTSGLVPQVHKPLEGSYSIISEYVQAYGSFDPGKTGTWRVKWSPTGAPDTTEAPIVEYVRLFVSPDPTTAATLNSVEEQVCLTWCNWEGHDYTYLVVSRGDAHSGADNLELLIPEINQMLWVEGPMSGSSGKMDLDGRHVLFDAGESFRSGWIEDVPLPSGVSDIYVTRLSKEEGGHFDLFRTTVDALGPSISIKTALGNMSFSPVDGAVTCDLLWEIGALYVEGREIRMRPVSLGLNA